MGYAHDNVIKWKHFPRYWPFVRGIHRSLVNSPHKGQWRGALVSSLICTRMHGWVNNGEAGDLRRHRAHYDVTVMMRKLMKHHMGLICACDSITEACFWPLHRILVWKQWSFGVGTIVTKRCRDPEGLLLSVAVVILNADYFTLFLWNELEPHNQMRANGVKLTIDQHWFG